MKIRFIVLLSSLFSAILLNGTLTPQSYANSGTAVSEETERSTQIVTDYENKAKNIYPLILNNIDGKEKFPTQGSYLLKPGTHTLKFRVVLNSDELKGSTRTYSRNKPLSITHNFEKNIRYFIGLKAKTKNSNHWKVVIWKKRPTKH